MILEFTIQQGQPIEIPEVEPTNPFMDEPVAPQEAPAKTGASNNGAPTKAADAFAERWAMRRSCLMAGSWSGPRHWLSQRADAGSSRSIDSWSASIAVVDR